MMNTPLPVKLIIAVFFLTVASASGHALTPSQVFDKVKTSVVVVKTLNAHGKVKSQGSGVILPFGRIVTNCHVVGEGVSFLVGRGSRLVSATLYAEDADMDICILTAKDIKGKPAQLGKATRLKVGAPVYAVGAPRGLELSLSDGIVAQLRGGPPPLIQTTAAISPGSSGGGLFDEEGHLVGLTTLYLDGGQSLNFAMPVEWISEIKKGHKPAEKGISQVEWWKRAAALYNIKNWQGLLDLCLKWTANAHNDADAWYVLGGAYSELHRYDDAIEAFRQSLRINPGHAAAWYDLGNTYGKLHRENDAIEAYHQSMRIDPDRADVWNNLGTTYGKLHRYDDAIEAFRQSLRINPERAAAWNNLGNAYGMLHRDNDAIEAYHQALSINPENSNTWFQLGISYALTRNRTAAMDVIRKLRLLDPGKADELFNLIVPR